MAVVLNCAKGHRWELESLRPPPGRKSIACPICGAPTIFSPGTLHDGQAAGSSQQTLTLRDEPSPVPSAWEQPTVAGYEILGELGRGGMGVVYWAWENGLNRVVALKMILAGAHASRMELTRFRTEAEAVAGLQHPNIVQIFTIGEQNGCPYISLEFVEGGSLTRKIAGTPQPPRQAAQLIETLAHAVHFAHQRGIIHRDLKPSNVLLTHSGVPKITDFGLAKRLEHNASMPTRTGAILGTPSYMAPEQSAKGKKVAEIGPATDVYSLGAILYEMLAGRPPFLADSPVDTLMQVLHEEPIPPRRFQQKVPRDLETICLKCLAKDPRSRYASAEALADDLHRFLTNVPIKARPSSAVERAIKWMKRRPAAAALLFVTILAAAGLLGMAIVTGVRLDEAAKKNRDLYLEAVQLRNEAQRKQKEEEELRLSAVESRRRAEEGELTARRHLYAGHMNLAQQALEKGNIKRLLELLEEQRPRPGEEDLRGFEWYYLWRFCHRETYTLRGHTDKVTCVAISPDGKRIVSAGRDMTIRLWDPEGKQEPATLQGHLDWVRAVAFSPDGKTLASVSDDMSVKLWDAAERKELATLSGHAGQVHCLAFSRDGRTLATGGLDRTVKLWDVAARQERTMLDSRVGSVGCVVFSPDGATLAVGGGESGGVFPVQLWNLEKAEVQTTLPVHWGAVKMAFSPDGKTLATGSDDTTVRLWDTATLQPRRTLKAHTGAIASLAFAADGRTLVTSSFDGTIRLWDPANGELRDTFYGHVSPVASVAFAPDSRQFVTGGDDQTVKMWNIAAEQAVDVLKGHTHPIQVVAFSPNGKVLASGDWNGTAKLWSATDGKELASFKAHDSPIFSLAFSPDGQTLATSGNNDETVKIWTWNGKSAEERATFIGHKGGVTYLAFSHDGRLLATGAKNKVVKLWDIASGQERAALEGHLDMIQSIAFTPDDKLMATGSWDKTIKLWDLSNHTERAALRQHTAPVNSVAFSADGRTLASASTDTTVKLWKAADGRELATLKGHSGSVTSVAFSPDRRTLASGSWDDTIKLWDAATGQQRATLAGHTNRIWSVAFSPDGKTLATGSYDRTIRIWRAAADKEATSGGQ